MSNNSTHSVKEYIIDAFNCKQDLANPIIAKKSINILRKAAESAGAKVIEIHCTTYTIHGFTTVALLAESHIILTTWPELDYASINIYLCNPEMDHTIVIDNIFKYLSERNIILAVREGIVRLSPHFYNTKEEIDKVVTELKNY